jgi:hypothetical protein
MSWSTHGGCGAQGKERVLQANFRRRVEDGARALTLSTAGTAGGLSDSSKLLAGQLVIPLPFHTATPSVGHICHSSYNSIALALFCGAM